MSIAQAHFGVKLAARRSEHEIEGLLEQLYESAWSDFDTEIADRSIEVYGVTPNASAVERLLAEGFSSVRQHWHDRAEFTHCDCRTHIAEPRRRLRVG